MDVVVYATPEHWHAQIAVDAMEAGKHVYVEKPMTRYADEGFAIADAVQRVAAEDHDRNQSLASALGADDRKVAAIAAAVGTYLSQQKMEEKS